MGLIRFAGLHREQNRTAPATARGESERHDEDVALVQRMAVGDEAAAAQLYDCWSARLYGYALALVREPADADEVLVDAFVAAWSNAHRFDRSRGTVCAWLGTLVRSRALDLIRARTRRQRAHERAGAELAGDLVGVSQEHASAPVALQGLVQHDLHKALSLALTTLPCTQREVIELSFLHGASHARVARLLGVPLGTVKTRARSGLRALRRFMQASELAASSW